MKQRMRKMEKIHDGVDQSEEMGGGHARRGNEETI